MPGLVVVSHSAKAAEGIVEVAREMGGDAVIEPVGGDPDGGIGTSPDDIAETIESVAETAEGAVVLVDLGSAVMNAELAIEMTAADAVIADAPILEGTVNAAVTAAGSKATMESVRAAAEETRGFEKL